MAFCECYSVFFVRSVENGIEPSQTYDEVKTSSFSTRSELAVNSSIFLCGLQHYKVSGYAPGSSGLLDS